MSEPRGYFRCPPPIRDETTGCLIWQGRLSYGYGRTRVNGKTMPAHRAAYISAHGLIAADLDVHHICGNRACVEIKHLQAVSRADHVRIDKRSNTGKLTMADVREIRASDLSHAELARSFGVSWQHVQNIRAGRRWKEAA